jgi:hypothetical protein
MSSAPKVWEPFEPLGSPDLNVVAAQAAYALKPNGNLAGLPNTETARTNLGLGSSATRNVGTTNGTVAAGDDARLNGNLRAAANLTDVASVAAARAALGIDGPSTVWPVGTGAGTVMAGDDARVVGVLAFGAVADGVTIDSAAIQAAADAVPASGGILLLAPGVYATNTPIFLKSNTRIEMYGATLLASVPWVLPDPSKTPYWNVGNFMLTNVNHGATIVDENIEVWGGTFDYRPMSQADAPNGGRHAVHFRAVRNVKVAHGTLYGGEDYTAFLRCDDTLVLGCSAYDFENCAYDHWSGAKNARVIGCFTSSSKAVQHVNFNATGDGILGQVAENFILQGCTLVVPPGGTFPYSSIFLDPLGAGSHTVKNVLIEGNQLHNIIITIRQDVQNVLIRGNQFFGPPSGVVQSPIMCYEDTGDTPDNIVVDGNVFHEPHTASPSVAVIDLRATNCRVTNNKITGTGYTVPVFSFGGRAGISFGNDYLGSADAGRSVASSGSIRAANNAGFSVQDINGDFARWYIQTDNNMVFTGLNASGNGRTAWSWEQRSNSSAWLWDVSVRHSRSLLRTLSDSLTATGANKAAALDLSAQFNNVTTVASGTGVELPDIETGELVIRVRNGGANALLVYPGGAGQIDALGTNNPYSLGVGEIGTWCLTSSRQWFTIGIHP